MTKLEEEINDAMNRAPMIPIYDVFNVVQEYRENRTLTVKAAAEVAKKYITKALTDFECCKQWQSYEGTKDQWLKENGIIE